LYKYYLMLSKPFKRPLLFIYLFVHTAIAFCQYDDNNFRNTQLSSARVSDAWKKYDDTLSRAFKKKNLTWPAKDIYIRVFKSQNEMELWGRNNETSEYKLVKTYRICALSGSLGPKRTKGDRQVPEGYYFIEEFNPNSEYYLSLKINYPNYADQQRSKADPGGEIYIHGGCVTIGCMPMTNEGIMEIYTICLNARLNGEENIPVHIYPTRLNSKGVNYLSHEFAKDLAKQQFWVELKTGYDYFEKYHKLLPVMYTLDGKYVN
jgi:murein L,D-transpeptidase YafK